jgi:hypothetical protein
MDYALECYSVGFKVAQAPEVVARRVRKAFKECLHEEAVERGGHGIFWNKRKDVMWAVGYWLDGNVKGFFVEGQIWC